MQDFNIWFACTYLPALTELPGIARVRRYLAMEGGPSHFVLHELSDAGVSQSTEWSELRRKLSAGRSGLYERIVEAP